MAKDQPIIDKFEGLMDDHPNWGFWKCFFRMRLDGEAWNHKRVWRVYCKMKLNIRRKAKRRLPGREPTPLDSPAEADHTWSFDFMSDALYGGHGFRVLNVIDEGTREALDIVVGTSISRGYVVRVMDQLVAEHAAPRRIRLDNGPEMTARIFTKWCKSKEIKLVYIQPGKPTQNALIGRFNRSFRTEILDAHLFNTLKQDRELAWAWRQSYNDERPHAALGNLPPLEFKRRLQAENSSIELCT